MVFIHHHILLLLECKCFAFQFCAFVLRSAIPVDELKAGGALLALHTMNDDGTCNMHSAWARVERRRSHQERNPSGLWYICVS